VYLWVFSFLYKGAYVLELLIILIRYLFLNLVDHHHHHKDVLFFFSIGPIGPFSLRRSGMR